MNSNPELLNLMEFDGGLPWEGEGFAIERLREDLLAGESWFAAVLRAIRRWDRTDDYYDGRRYNFLIAGEAFDWLALVERFYAELAPLFPADEIQKLLFAGEPPGGFDEPYFREMIGPAKYRTYLNHHYGIVVEEALTRSAEEDLLKERMTGVFQSSSRIFEDIFERVYSVPLSDLLLRFRAEQGLGDSDRLAYGDWKHFTYWCFKYRIRQAHRMKVAADTKRGLDTLDRLRSEALTGFEAEPEPATDPIEIAPWRFRVVK